MTAPMVLDGPTNGIAFRASIEQVLIPTLPPDDTVVMDNLPARKADGVQTAIEAIGASMRFLSPDSSDFNPIETTFSKLKAFLRAMVERIVEPLRSRRLRCRLIGRRASCGTSRSDPAPSPWPCRREAASKGRAGWTPCRLAAPGCAEEPGR
ncbi:hypothetical protein D3218_17705 [Aureimonas flava]|uniref:Tc1-like transposase DDE domain-containing protein n=1 Tax=Aureimonas flava TaxID=2320271 RepID=A0A3A1WGV8_9HYPH|nr:hypothetical protein D3218_17705 [Aureimonas flava]